MRGADLLRGADPLPQHLVSQQKDADPEEYKRLLAEKDSHLKRIQLLAEDNGKLKAEVTR